MATLASGQSVTLNLAGDQFVLLTTQPNTEGSLLAVPVAGSTPTAGDAGTYVGSVVNTKAAHRFGPPAVSNRQFGPYGMPVIVTLASTAGAITYQIGGGGALNALLTDNTAAAAAANTAAIQTALNAGGLVQITTPGTYYINATLTIYSNTRLVLGAGVTLTMISGAGGKPVLQNYAYSLRASPATVTLSWSSGITAAITGWTNHGCSIGDYVWLQGATLSAYNVIGYLSAANSAAGTATVVLNYVPSGAVSGTITALKCDRNITIEGPGTFDYNQPLNTTGGSTLNSCGITLGCVQNLTINNINIQNAEKFALMYGACRDYIINGVNIPVSNSDAVHGYGPLVDGRVINTSGTCGDDGVILQPRENSAFPNFVWTNGDVINVHVDGVNLRGTLAAAGLVQLYPNGTDKMIGIKISRVGGITNAGGGVQVIAAQSASDTIESLEIDHVSTYGAYGVRIDKSSSNAAIVNYLRVRGLQENSASTSAIPFYLGTSCVVKDGEVDVNVNSSAFTSGQYAAQIAGTYQRLKFTGSIIGGSTARGIQIQAAQTGELIVGMTQRTGDQLVGGAAVSGTITLQGCDTGISNVISTSNVSGTVNVNLQGNRFNNASGGVVRSTTNGATFNIRSGGNDWRGTSVPAVAPSGTPVFNVYGWDLAVDIGATGFNKTTAGQYCFNNGSARGTIAQNRLVICNGTNWLQSDNLANVF